MKLFALLFAIHFSFQAKAANFEGNISAWKSEPDHFSDAEKNFKEAFKRLHEKYVDKNLSDEDLYRAATAGMLASLNTGEESWNKLISPREFEDLQIEMSGKLSGVGATLKFDEETGIAHVLYILEGSGAQKAGLKRGDQILNVNGQRFKKLPDMVSVLRGPSGKTVSVNVLREDKIISFKITRGNVKIPLFSAQKMDSKAALMKIGGFTSDASNQVETLLKQFEGDSLQRLVIDLRSNQGGDFEQSLKVAELFIPKNSKTAQTKSRLGKTKDYVSQKEAWSPKTQIVLLVDKETASGAELLAAALKEQRHAILVGTSTRGKWTVESVENLPNNFSIKYSIMQFESPSGKSYQGSGLKPDFEVASANAGRSPLAELESISTVEARLEKDAPLKAALSLQP